MDDGFLQEWLNCEERIRGYVGSRLRDQNAADEVAQATAIRCWRGFASFRGDCPFCAWAFAIARREIIRHYQQRRLASLVEEVPGRQIEACPDSQDEMLDASIVQAVAAGFLSAEQGKVLQSRLGAPELTWDKIGESLQMKGATCAVVHMRAIRDFRVYLFVEVPDRCGGAKAIAEAFKKAARRDVDPLTEQERQAFQSAVIEKRESPLARGILSRLREACVKVAVELDRS